MAAGCSPLEQVTRAREPSEARAASTGRRPEPARSIPTKVACDLLIAFSLFLVVGGPAGSGDLLLQQQRGVQLEPDHAGALSDIVLHYDPKMDREVGPTYRDLLRAFAPASRVWVITQDREHFARFQRKLEQWGIKNLARFHPVLTQMPISTWSRDRYSLLRQGQQRVLLVRARPNRGALLRQNDWQTPFILARAAGPEVEARKVPLVFDGGDLIATGQHVFATALLAHRNRGGALGNPAALGQWLRTNLGLTPVLLGRTAAEVPSHHIGMFLTPLDEQRMLVGDPQLGLALLPLGTKLARPVDRRPETLRRFFTIRSELTRRGYQVIDVPLVPLDDGLTYVTYNNAILERRADGRQHAYVPQFGIAPLDAAGRAAYERQGVVVHPIDVRQIYHRNGTVRCLVNVLDRQAHPSS